MTKSAIGADELQRALTEYDKQKLESITPEEAVRTYLEARDDLEDSTVRDYERSLDHFTDFCEENELGNLNDLTGKFLEEYRQYRRKEAAEGVDVLAPKTQRDEQYLLQNFVKYLEKIDAVEERLHHKVTIPNIGPKDGVREELLEKERIQDIIDHLRRFEYASLENAVWIVLSEIGGRISGTRAPDLEDCYFSGGDPHIELRHRPDEDTPLKNDEQSEREVTISLEASQILEDYIENHRPDVVDQYGNEPLLATEKGRISRTTIRRYVYKWTRPCQVSGDCPHGKEINECPAAESKPNPSDCPSIRPPHAIRTWVHHL